MAHALKNAFTKIRSGWNKPADITSKSFLWGGIFALSSPALLLGLLFAWEAQNQANAVFTIENQTETQKTISIAGSEDIRWEATAEKILFDFSRNRVGEEIVVTEGGRRTLILNRRTQDDENLCAIYNVAVKDHRTYAQAPDSFGQSGVRLCRNDWHWLWPHIIF
ncbi:MAG TPA: hypothetical protein VIN59_09505 [Alphaproteobacteria bacterium]